MLFGLFEKKETEKINAKDLVEDIIQREADDLEDLFVDANAQFLSDLNADEMATIVPNMLRDDQVSSDMETFKSYVTGQSYEVKINETLESDSTATGYLDFYNEMLTYNGGQILSDTDALLESLDYGWVICQVIWDEPENNGGKYIIKRLEPLDHTKFGFNKKGEYINLEDESVLDEPYKFVHVTHDIKNGNLYGNAMTLNAYWPWMFKKACIRSGVLYAKKSIIPSLIAIYKAADNDTDTRTRGTYIASQLAKLNNNSGVAMTNVESVESVNATSKGTDIIDLVGMFNGMISKAILGTSTLTNDTKYSNRGDSNNLNDIITRRSKKVAQKELQPAINTLFRWHLILNTPSVDFSKLPYFAFAQKYDPSLKEVLDTVSTQQIPVSLNWFRNKFNMKAPEDEEDIAGKPVEPSVEVISNSSSSDDSFFLQKHQTNAPKTTLKILRELRKNSETQ